MPFEHKDLNLSPRTHVKKAKGRLICNPSTGQTKTRGSLGLTGQLVLPNWWAPVPSERLWKDGWCSCIPEDNIYAHTCTHSNINNPKIQQLYSSALHAKPEFFTEASTPVCNMCPIPVPGTIPSPEATKCCSHLHPFQALAHRNSWSLTNPRAVISLSLPLSLRLPRSSGGLSLCALKGLGNWFTVPFRLAIDIW